jgi:hypothetical protein
MSEQPADRFDAVTVVWGPEFRRLFLDVCLPNQITPGNLGALPAGSRYRIFTSAEDVGFFEASATVARLKDVIPVDLVVRPELSVVSADPFGRLNACHQLALDDAARAGTALIILSPDMFMSEGTLAAAVGRHAGGSRAVACAGIRLDRDAFVSSLQRRGDVHTLSGRELVALALEHLHPFTRAHMIDGARTPRRPTGVLWSVPGEGILARFFYLHPLLIDPVRRGARLESTIDHRFLTRVCPVPEQIHVVSDSDEMAVFEMSHVDAAPVATAPGGVSLWRAIEMIGRCDAHQVSYWTRPIRLHASGIGAAWTPVDTQSALFARRVTRLRVAGLWSYRMSRLFRPLRRRAGRWRQHLRDAAKPLSPRRVRRSIVRAASPARKLALQAARSRRVVVRRARRSVVLLMHSAARPLQTLRKRSLRASRRLLRRVRAAHS